MLSFGNIYANDSLANLYNKKKEQLFWKKVAENNTKKKNGQALKAQDYLIEYYPNPNITIANGVAELWVNSGSSFLTTKKSEIIASIQKFNTKQQGTVVYALVGKFFPNFSYKGVKNKGINDAASIIKGKELETFRAAFPNMLVAQENQYLTEGIHFSQDGMSQIILDIPQNNTILPTRIILVEVQEGWEYDFFTSASVLCRRARTQIYDYAAGAYTLVQNTALDKLLDDAADLAMKDKGDTFDNIVGGVICLDMVKQLNVAYPNILLASNQQKVVTDYNNTLTSLNTNAKIDTLRNHVSWLDEIIAQILPKAGNTGNTGIYVIATGQSRNTIVIDNGGGVPENITLTPTQMWLLQHLYGKAGISFVGLKEMQTHITGLLTTADPTYCHFCPTRKVGLTVIQHISDLYNKATDKTKATTALKKLCKENDIFYMPYSTNVLGLDGFTPQELDGFFEDIVTSTQDNRHIAKNVAMLNVEMLKTWKYIYTSGFEEDFEYIRTLSYKGYPDNPNPPTQYMTAFVDMTNRVTHTVTKGTTSGTKTMTITCNGFSNSISKIGNVSHITAECAPTVGIEGTPNYSLTQTNSLLNVVPLLPNAIYVVDSYVKFTTNAKGRVEKIEATLQGNARGRDSYQTQQAKHFKDGVKATPVDHGGHMIAAQFNGPVEQINYFPQLASQNSFTGGVNAGWYKMEGRWRTNIASTVKVEITPVFATDTSKRPDSFKVKYWYGGIAQTDPNNATPDIFIIPNL